MFRLTVVVALLACACASVIQPRYGDDLDGRIVGGEATTIQKYPYQVSLLKDGSLFCGGSLYSEDIVITAAHCMQTYTASQFKVRCGSSEYSTGGELVSVRSFKNHEGYDKNLLINDVAVIKLDTPVRFTDKIQPIELASSVPSTGSPAFVTGWGTNRYLIGSIQATLNEVEVEIVTAKDCSSDVYNYGSQVGDTMVCAGVDGGGKDACQGDSGGPLASGGKLVGIVSWGNMCARKNYPGVYSSVPELREWIIKTAAEL